MRALIFSDTHGDISALERAIKHYKSPEYRFGLGDYEIDFYLLDCLGVTGVRGNSFFDPEWDYDFIYSMCKFRILFTHGHKYSVKAGLLRLKMKAKQENIDICFYGHTHEARIDEDEGIYFINPGSAGMPFSPSFSTICYMEINDNKAYIEIVDSVTFEIYKKIEIVK